MDVNFFKKINANLFLCHVTLLTIGIKKAIDNAKKTGIGLVAVKNSGHYGLSGYYAEQAVKKNTKKLKKVLLKDVDFYKKINVNLSQYHVIQHIFGTKI